MKNCGEAVNYVDQTVNTRLSCNEQETVYKLPFLADVHVWLYMCTVHCASKRECKYVTLYRLPHLADAPLIICIQPAAEIAYSSSWKKLAENINSKRGQKGSLLETKHRHQQNVTI